MKHLGDITLIKGDEAPIVDCIIGGSPCQDLSVAGKRAGLAGARSGLYMEQIRIIKEMREADVLRGRADVDIRPRYMVWENVPGAFSTNQGKDFAAVLEEAIRVAEPEAPDVHVPEKGWPTSGCYFDEMGKWSVAWRVMDAQFWGVPQRRRRICLVADFNGLNAPKIVFGEAEHHGSTERGGGDSSVGHSGAKPRSSVQPLTQGLPGNLEQSEQARQETARDAGEGSGGAGGAVVFNGANITSPINKTNPQPGDPCHTLTDDSRNWLVQPVTFEPGIARREGGHIYDGVSGTLRAHAGDNQMAVAYSIENHPADSRVDIDESGKVQTLTSRMGTGGGNVPMVMEAIGINGDIAGTLDASYYKGGKLVLRHIVRRLTPLECELLQGFPKNWTKIGDWVDSKGKRHKEADSPRYKALGNSIAISPWKWILKRLCTCYERDATMASLFDGIGGFPYIWEQLNGKGSCLWASEIEEFPMAVTRLRFGDG